MKTALLTVALGAGIALAWANEPAQATGLALAESSGGGNPQYQLSDAGCDGNANCIKDGTEAKAGAESNGTDETGAEAKTDAAGAGQGEATAKPEPEESTSLAAGNGSADTSKEDADKDDAEDQADEEAEEEDDEWDDGPYEDPLGFDDD